MKTHFYSKAEYRTACGTFNPKEKTEDHLSVTCGRCLKAITRSAETGEMIFHK